MTNICKKKVTIELAKQYQEEKYKHSKEAFIEKGHGKAGKQVKGKLIQKKKQGARTLPGAPGLTTRNKKLLGALGIATNGARSYYEEQQPRKCAGKRRFWPWPTFGFNKGNMDDLDTGGQ